MTYYGRNDEYEDDVTPKQWSKIRQLAEAGDAANLVDFLMKVGISPYASKMFILAVAEHKRYAAIYTKGKDASQHASTLGLQLHCTQLSRVMDPEAQVAKIIEMRTKIAELNQQDGEAYVAAAACQGLLTTFPRLFALKPLDEGTERERWPPSVGSPPAIAQELHRLGLPDCVVEPFRFLEDLDHTLQTRPLQRNPSPIGTAAMDLER